MRLQLPLFFVALCASLHVLRAHPAYERYHSWSERPAVAHYEYVYGVQDETEPRIHNAESDYLSSKVRTVQSFPLTHGSGVHYHSNAVPMYAPHTRSMESVWHVTALPESIQRRYEPEWEEGWRLLRHDDGVKYEGDWFSEEDSGLSRILPYPIYGMKCSGHLCDNKLPMFVMPNRRAPLFPHVSTWTTWTSDSDSNFHGVHNVAHCPKGQFAIQIQCWGAYCKSMRLGCSKLRSEFRAQYEVGRYDNAEKDDTSLNSPFSNERGGTGYCPDGEYLDGIQCLSWFCNYVRLFCSRIQISTKWSLLIPNCFVTVGQPNHWASA